MKHTIQDIKNGGHLKVFEQFPWTCRFLQYQKISTLFFAVLCQYVLYAAHFAEDVASRVTKEGDDERESAVVTSGIVRNHPVEHLVVKERRSYVSL